MNEYMDGALGRSPFIALKPSPMSWNSKRKHGPVFLYANRVGHVCFMNYDRIIVDVGVGVEC